MQKRQPGQSCTAATGATVGEVGAGKCPAAMQLQVTNHTMRMLLLSECCHLERVAHNDTDNRLGRHDDDDVSMSVDATAALQGVVDKLRPVLLPQPRAFLMSMR